MITKTPPLIELCRISLERPGSNHQCRRRSGPGRRGRIRRASLSGKRQKNGLTNQTSYTWSRSLGDAANDGVLLYLNPRNRSLNKTLLSFHRTHSFRTNGTFELPFGPDRQFLRSGPGLLTHLVERWQLGGIVSWVSGASLTITASTSSFTQNTGKHPSPSGQFS